MNEVCAHVTKIHKYGVDCALHGKARGFGLCATCPDSTAIGWECPYLKKTLNRKNRPCGCNKGEQSSEKKQQE